MEVELVLAEESTEAPTNGSDQLGLETEGLLLDSYETRELTRELTEELLLSSVRCSREDPRSVGTEAVAAEPQ